MGITIGSNISAMRAERALAKSSETRCASFMRLSSGMRINRASDDAAGLAVASSLRTDARVYSQALRNINDGVSALNIAQGALEQLTTISIRQKELATQSANGPYSLAQRRAMNVEAQALTEEFNRITRSTDYNGMNLIDKSLTELRIQAGYGSDGSIAFSIADKLARVVGDGSFSAGGTISGGAVQFVTADFDRDGCLDFINTGKIYLGNGDGTFDSAVTYTTLSAIYSVAAGDLNGDGILDLMVGSYNNDSATALIGNGDGTFRGLISGDVAESTQLRTKMGSMLPNGTGAYFFISSASKDYYVWFNRDGTTADPLPAGGRTGIEVVVALADSAQAVATKMLNAMNLAAPGEFSFTAPSPTGLIDVTNTVAGSVTDASNAGNAVFTVTILQQGSTALVTNYTGDKPKWVNLIDVNQDGKLDLISPDSGDNRLSVYLGNGDGTFKARMSYAAGTRPYAVVGGDFNGDGIVDLATADYTTGVSVFFGNGDGTFAARKQVVAESGVRQIKAGDFNRDGVSDLILADSETSIILGNGDGSFSTRLTLGPVSYDLNVTDLNGDGNLDVAATGSNLAVANVFLGKGDGTFGARLSYATSVGGAAIGAGDFNGDGAGDLLLGRVLGANVSTLFANTTEVTTASYLNLCTRGSALEALGVLDATLQRISSEIGAIGSTQSRFAVALNTLSASRENLEAAAGRIMDTDIAEESATLARTQILQQAGAAVLAQANQQPALALGLLPF